MKRMHNIKQMMLSISLILLLSGCATVDPDFADPGDPWEGFNRSVFSFNQMVDDAFMKPLSEVYKGVTPEPVDKGITNFFNNLGGATSAINHLLQFKVEGALDDVSRIVINTTFGIGGLFDVASDLNLPREEEDFGQTLGVWGVDSGPYLVLPLFGPSSVRDAVGKVGDGFTSPVSYVKDDTLRYSLQGLDLLDTRADLLKATKVIDEAALDSYAFIRDAYLQRRRNVVHDGNPPPRDEDF